MRKPSWLLPNLLPSKWCIQLLLTLPGRPSHVATLRRQGAGNTVPTGELTPRDKSTLWTGAHNWAGSWLSAVVKVVRSLLSSKPAICTTEMRHLPFLSYPPNGALPSVSLAPFYKCGNWEPESLNNTGWVRQLSPAAGPECSPVLCDSTLALLTFTLNCLKTNVTTSFFIIWLLELLAPGNVKRKISEEGPHGWGAGVSFVFATFPSGQMAWTVGTLHQPSFLESGCWPMSGQIRKVYYVCSKKS